MLKNPLFLKLELCVISIIIDRKVVWMDRIRKKAFQAVYDSSSKCRMTKSLTKCINEDVIHIGRNNSDWRIASFPCKVKGQ